MISDNNSRILEKDSSFFVKSSDVRVDTYRASGNGGQHRNKTDSAVRLTHIPTGTMVTATEDRSQHVNRKVAFERLTNKLESINEQVLSHRINEDRKSFMSGSRSFSWTEWRDELKTSDGVRVSMKKALAGKLDKVVSVC